jgi:hypothetical protein
MILETCRRKGGSRSTSKSCKTLFDSLQRQPNWALEGNARLDHNKGPAQKTIPRNTTVPMLETTLTTPNLEMTNHAVNQRWRTSAAPYQHLKRCGGVDLGRVHTPEDGLEKGLQVVGHVGGLQSSNTLEPTSIHNRKVALHTGGTPISCGCAPHLRRNDKHGSGETSFEGPQDRKPAILKNMRIGTAGGHPPIVHRTSCNYKKLAGKTPMTLE